MYPFIPKKRVLTEKSKFLIFENAPILKREKIFENLRTIKNGEFNTKTVRRKR